jgi:hypothetical protein
MSINLVKTISKQSDSDRTRLTREQRWVLEVLLADLDVPDRYQSPQACALHHSDETKDLEN